MPPLQLFGRSWHMSSDDLVLPAFVGIAFHGTWTALLTAEVAIIGLPDDCAGYQLATSSVLWLLVSFGLTTFLQCVVAGISMRGAMLEERKRAAMPTALYCLLSAYCLEAAALVYATTVHFGVLKDTLSSCHTAEELARTSMSELSMHRWFVGTTWAMLVVIGGLLILLYNLYPDRSLESWEKRVNCLSYLLCCRKALTGDPEDEQAPSSSAPTVVRIARVFGDMFYPLNFSFTDIVAAITLVGITHRSSAHGHGSSCHNHALIAAAGAGLFAPTRDDDAGGAVALLGVAAAAAAAPQAANSAAAAACTPAVALGAKVEACSVYHGVQADGQPSAAAAPGTPMPGSAAPSLSVTGRSKSATVQGPGSLQPMNSTEQPAAGLHPQSPGPRLKGIHHSSSTGNLPSGLSRGNSPTPQEGVSFVRTGSSSAWEAAVRQGSALAVAPGRGIVSAGPGGSRANSPSLLQTSGMPARSQSTYDAAAAHERPPSKAPMAHRAMSWGGGAPPNQQHAARSSEQGLGNAEQSRACDQTGARGQALLHSLAESNEFSITPGAQFEQVESLLSPLPSSDIAALAEGGRPAAGAAAAGDSISHIPAQSADCMDVKQATVVAAAQQKLPVPQALQHAALEPSQAGAAAATEGAAAAVAGLGPAAAQPPAAQALAEEAVEELGVVLSEGQPVSLALLEEALHWHPYANAIYGWPMFLWSHRYRVVRCCRLCCGGCCQGAPDRTPGSTGGLGMAPEGLSASTAGSDKTNSKTSSANSNGVPVTAVVTLSSVDTDSTSPLSTAAGGGALHAGAIPGGPLAEGHEGPEQQEQQLFEAAASSDWDPEQGRVSSSLAQAGTVQNAIAAASAAPQEAAGKCCSPAAADGHPAVPTNSSRSGRRWVQSRGNIWLLQGLADALGVGREPAGVDAAVEPPGSQSGGDKGGLSSVAGGLWPDAGLCGCACGGTWGPSHVPKMAPLTASQRLTNEAIMQTANIPAADLLYVNYNNLVEGLLPYSVVLDVAKRCVVVAIRGSLSVEDCVTDILYDPAPLDADWLVQPAAVQPQQQAAEMEPCGAAPVPGSEFPQAAELAASSAADAGSHQLATEQALLQLQFQQQLPRTEGLDGVPARAGRAAQSMPGALGHTRSMPGASSGGGSFRSVSMKASPFASAAAAASAAARNSSTGAENDDSSSRPARQAADLGRMPSVPAAQAAAAAAAAAGRPLPPASGRTMKKHWSMTYGGTQQQLAGGLSEQPSAVRRGSSSRRQLVQQAGDAGQLSPRASILDTALNKLRAPWRRHTASDADEHHQQQRQQHPGDAAVAAEEGRLPKSFPVAASGVAASSSNSPRRGSTDCQEPGSGSSSPRRLLKSFSLNLGTVLSGSRAAGSQQQPSGRRRLAVIASSRLLSPRRDQGLTSCASEQVPSSSSRRGSTDNWRQSQTRRTTAADRALGAARAGHRFAPMTSPATDMSAAAAAASQRDFALQLHQQLHRQQQHHQLSSMPSMRSTAPASTEASVSAAGVAAGGLGVVSEPGSGPRRTSSLLGSPWTQTPAGDVCNEEFLDSHDNIGSSRSRRTTLTHLPRINSGGGAASEQLPEPHLLLQQEQQQGSASQQQLLSMMASMPVPNSAEQQQSGHGARPVSDDGGSWGGSTAGRRPLRATVSDVGKWARRFRLPLPSQQQQQQLSDGGPTDWSLLTGAATMVPSRTAAVPQPGVTPAATTPGLSMSYSARPPVAAPNSAGLSMSYSARPSGVSFPAGVSAAAASSAAAAAPGSDPAGDSTALTGHSVHGVGADRVVIGGLDDESPFMLHQHADPSHSTYAAAAAGADAQYLRQQQPQWMMQPLLDMASGEPGTVAAAAAAAAMAAAAEEEQASVAGAAEVDAAAEADAFAAAAQAAAAENTPDTGAAGAQWFAHEGILKCARAIRDDLERLGLLDQLLLGPQYAEQQQAGLQGSRADTGESDIAACCDSAAAPSAAANSSSTSPSAATGAAGAKSGAGCAEEGRWLRSTELPDCRGWTLMLTGHSLGAGVAALLALHYRARYESVRCWCFAPPGGLMSPAAAASLKDICYSLVSAKDMIPRLSLWTIERLRDEMMICSLRCKIPKYKLLLGAALGKKWEEEEVLRPLDELSDAEVNAFLSYRRAVVEERLLDPLRVRIAREFVPPGEILWLERSKELQPRLRAPNASGHAVSAPADAQPAAGSGTAAASTAVARPSQRLLGVGGQIHGAGREVNSTQVGSASSAAVGMKHSASSGLLRGSAALEAAAAAVAGKRVVSKLQPHLSDGLGLIVGGMVVSRNMFADHLPDKQLVQLRRLVRNLRRKQAAGQQLPPGITPVVVVQPPQQQECMPARRLLQ